MLVYILKVSSGMFTVCSGTRRILGNKARTDRERDTGDAKNLKELEEC